MMQCPHCHSENPETARFCMACGQSLARTCARCGAELPPAARFCPACGQAVDAGSGQSGAAPQPDTALHRYIPRHLLDKLEAARSSGRMVGERRIVSMLFCDVKGSTAAAQNLDPEDWTEIINGAFEPMIQPIFRYEGTVARLMGDGILAFFGAPIAHEDDPQRAVLAGLDIVAGIEPYRRRIEQRWGIDLQVRVGINTGLVVVGAVGSDLRMEYSALGDAINLAARMEQTAPPGVVQISEDTQRLVAPLFDLEATGPLQVKGRREAVQAYLVRGRRAQPERLRGLAGAEAPLIGRQRELELLGRVLEDLTQGRGQVVCLIGEAGLGKSRLVDEIKARWQEREAREASGLSGSESGPSGSESGLSWCESQGVSFDRQHPYLQFQQQIRCLVGGVEGDSPAALRQKLAAWLERLPPSQQEASAPILRQLLALDSESEAPEGATFKTELYETMQQVWRAWAAAPVVCVFDDLHWADQASVELLQHLLPLAETLPILFLCVFRPDRNAPGWQIKTFVDTRLSHRRTEIALQPLSAGDSSLLVNSLLTVADLPAALRNQILDRAEGNPFFVEEIIRTLIEDRVLVADAQGRWQSAQGVDLSHLALPDNLQGLLVARIDRLEESARQTLQMAAVIGKRFYHRVLALISEAANEMDRQLLVLERAELISEAARFPELEYVFRHSLTQEAAYNTILRKRRRLFHRRVAEAVEALFGDRLPEFYPMLAHHFDEASDARALSYHTLAGDAAFRLFAIPEALGHYKRALALAGPDTATADLAHLYLRCGRCQELANDYQAAIDTYQAVVELAERRQEPALNLSALSAQATAYAIPTPSQDAARARALSQQALQLAQELGDREAEARILWNLLLVDTYSGGMGLSIHHGEAAADLARELGLDELLAHTLQDLSLNYMAVGRLAQTRAALQEAAALWQAQENVAMLAENKSNAAGERVMAGDLDGAIRLSEEAFALCERIHNVWGQGNSLVFVNLVHLARGEIDRAMASIKRAITIIEPIGHPGLTAVQTQLGLLYSHLGAYDQAEGALQQALASAEHFQPFRFLPLILQGNLALQQGRSEEAAAIVAESMAQDAPHTLLLTDMETRVLQARLALSRGHSAETAEIVESLLAFVRDSDIRFYLPQALQFKARVLRGQGDRAGAATCLLEAQAAATEMAARMMQWPILLDLAALEEEAARPERAAAWREQAAAIVARIASHTGDPELRASFINRPELQPLDLTHRLHLTSQEKNP